MLFTGGAIVSRLSHRTSIDFDFVSDTPLDRTSVSQEMPRILRRQRLEDLSRHAKVSSACSFGLRSLVVFQLKLHLFEHENQLLAFLARDHVTELLDHQLLYAGCPWNARNLSADCCFELGFTSGMIAVSIGR